MERIRIIVLPLVILGIGAAAVITLNRNAQADEQGLSASGTVEAVQIRIASDIGGQVKEVMVAEGDTVDEGQILIRLDDALLQTQRVQTEAGIAQAQAAAAAAELEQISAQQAYDALFEFTDEPDEDVLSLAQARLDLAAAQGSSADAALAAAEAAMQAMEIQIEKAEVKAPAGGLILYRNVQPGEVVAPGAPLLVLLQQEELTITVFLPEDRYGEVGIGDTAEVEVDSFPGEAFTATVLRIADQAEFTPRNVQTGEGRRTTVFAITLRVDDPAGRLKPGMPADIYFSRE